MIVPIKSESDIAILKAVKTITNASKSWGYKYAYVNFKTYLLLKDFEKDCGVIFIIGGSNMSKVILSEKPRRS